MKDDGTQREFNTGATRSSQLGRIDPEGFLSPLSLERYCQYLLKHQVQADGTTRDSDNWQKGMPLATYIKGMFRHFLHFWTRHRGWEPMDDKSGVDIQEDLCAIIFNAQGYLHEVLRLEREEIGEDEEQPEGSFLTMSCTEKPAGLTLVWPPTGDPIDLDTMTTFPRRPDYVAGQGCEDETPPPPPETRVMNRFVSPGANPGRSNLHDPQGNAQVIPEPTCSCCGQRGVTQKNCPHCRDCEVTDPRNL